MDKPRDWILAVLTAWVGQLFYMVLPFDILPDFLPVLGWLDDLGLGAMVLAFTVYGAVRAWQALERRGAALPKPTPADALPYEPVHESELLSW